MHEANTTTMTSINIGELPSVPHILLKLVDTCHDVDASFEELAQEIRQDSGLCAKIISVSNTPVYAQWNGIKDFNRLVVILGLEPIKSISITAIVQQFFSQFDQKLGQCMGLLWNESLTCAHTAKALAVITGYPSPDEAYLTGLLHNIGKLAILKLKPDDYSSHLLEGHHQSQDSIRFERDLVGATSIEIGAHMMSQSVTDSFVSDALYFQAIDAEQIVDSGHLIKLINLSARLTCDGFNSDEVAESANQLFGLNQDVLDDIASPVRESVEKTAIAYGIKLSKTSPVNIDNQEIRLELAKRVKGFALLHGASKETENGKNGVIPWEDISRNLKILFGFDSMVVFQPIANGELLRTAATFNAGPINEPLTIPLRSNQSTICKAARDRHPLFEGTETEKTQLSVLDHQLRRLLAAEALVAIPVASHDTLFGVIAAGVKTQQLGQLRQSSDFIQQYTHEAAIRIQQRSEMDASHQLELEESHLQHTAETRELIHEANNPLGVMKNYLYVLSAKLEDNDEVSQQLDTLKSEIDRVGTIISRMRDVGKNSSSSTEESSSVNINQVIRRLMSVYSSSIFITHNITEGLDLDDSLDPIELKKSGLKQILTNLIKNAVEAMPSGGIFKITTKNDININGNNYIEVQIVDSGTGIQKHILDNIFSPVQSTKGSGHSGLGLSIVKNLITEMDGTISVQNNKDRGATFILHFPKRV